MTEAIAAERAAADRLRVADDELRKAVWAEERAQRDQVGPKKQRKALTRKRDAADIVQRFRGEAEGKTAARVNADQELAAHRARLASLEDAAVAAERDAENPPAQVPPSIWTALLAHPLQVLLLPDLGAEARALAAAQVTTLASLSGVDAQLRAEGRAALEAELLRQNPGHGRERADPRGPRPGPPLRPGEHPPR